MATNWDHCEECDGEGTLECPICEGVGFDENDDPCEECGGSGQVECDVCFGTGQVEVE